MGPISGKIEAPELALLSFSTGYSERLEAAMKLGIPRLDQRKSENSEDEEDREESGEVVLLSSITNSCVVCLKSCVVCLRS